MNYPGQMHAAWLRTSGVGTLLGKFGSIDVEEAYRRYSTQRANARRRKIGFRLTFEQWLTIWFQSGKYHLRGRTQGSYQMGRHQDIGDYAVGNVAIISQSENVAQNSRKAYLKNKCWSAARRAASSRKST